MHEDDPRPRMTLHLQSRYSPIADLAAALFWAIDDSGPRLPPRCEIARMAGVSETTVSRRFRDRRSTEGALVARLAGARGATFPPGWEQEGWARWVPRGEREVREARVWLVCLAFAAYSPDISEAVCAAWDQEQLALVRGLAPMGTAAGDAQAVQALVLGLVTLRAVDPGFTHERGLELLLRVVDALGRAPVGPLAPDTTRTG